MTGRIMNGADLARGLADAAEGAIDDAVAAAAGRVAEAIAAGQPNAKATIRHGGGGVRVMLVGPGLFAREYGTLDSAADPAVTPALRRLKRRPA